MKLIELLMQELPKRGGWPEVAVCATQDGDGEIYFSEGAAPKFSGVTAWHKGDWCGNEFYTVTAEDYDTAIVTREQYEAALAAAQQLVWDGEGLPPVGCECELSTAVEIYTHSGSTDFEEGTVIVVGGVVNFGLGDFVAVKVKGKNCITYINPIFLRPIRSEADKRRDAVIEFITGAIDSHGVDPLNSAQFIYDAIAAGKIPGVKLSD